MIDHVGFEVSDLGRATRFYDAVFFALGARRMFESEHAVAYGINSALIWFVVRGRRPAPGTATSPCRRAARRRSTPHTPPGWPTAAPTTVRRGSGRSTGGAITPSICATRTACGWRSSPAADQNAAGGAAGPVR